MFTLLALFGLAFAGLTLKTAGVAAFIALGAGVVAMSALTDEPFVAFLRSIGLCGSLGQLTPFCRVVAKVADYAVLATDGSGTTFTNRGAAGTVVFTLPVASPQLAGYRFRFKGHAAQTITVASSPADTLVCLNDVAADSLSLSTGGQIIGGEIEAFCDGTSWFASVITVGHAGTIAT